MADGDVAQRTSSSAMQPKRIRKGLVRSKERKIQKARDNAASLLSVCIHF